MLKKIWAKIRQEDKIAELKRHVFALQNENKILFEEKARANKTMFEVWRELRDLDKHIDLRLKLRTAIFQLCKRTPEEMEKIEKERESSSSQYLSAQDYRIHF